MAITIESDCETYTPVYNDIEISVSSSNVAQANFKFVFDLYIEGVSGFKRFRVIPDITTDFGYVNVRRTLEGYIYSTLSSHNSVVPFSLGANANGTQSIIKWYIKYGEEYGTTPTIYADLLTGADKYSWNGSLDFHDWLDFDYTDYICNISNGVNGQFLTDMKTNYVSIYNLGWHHILSDTPTDIDRVVYRLYDSSGTLLSTNIKAISVAQNLVASRMYKVATGPESINNLTGAWVSGGPSPIIDGTVSYYTVQLTDSAGTVASELLTFYLEEECDYEQVRLHFLNRFGSFDAFNFNFQSNITRSVEKKVMKYNPYNMTSNGIERSHREQSQIQHFTKTQDTIKIRSRYLTEAENNWLKQLVESPEIYMEFTDASAAQNYKSIEGILETNWEEKTLISDKLFPLDITLKLGHSNHRQRR